MDFKEKRILGMIHLSGDNSNRVERALAEIAIYKEEGLYGCIIENYHGSVDDVENVLLSLMFSSNTFVDNFKIGINILPNEYKKSFELAKRYSVDFIQLDYISGKYNPNISLNEDYFLSCSNQNSDVKVFGGVWPKYYQPIDGSDLGDDIVEGLFLCDGIVVTGEGTGKETSLDKIKKFGVEIASSSIYHKTPLIIGAGLDASNVVEQLEFAQGAIVGSCFKPFKRTQEMVSRELVKEFMNEIKKIK